MRKRDRDRINRDNSDYDVNWKAVAEELWEELNWVLQSEYSQPAEPMNYWISVIRENDKEA